VKSFQDQVAGAIMSSPPTTTAEVYSRAAGELKGVAAIEMIATAIIQNGKEAEAQRRSGEEGS